MESSFGKLYRTSRLASFDPKIRQVYTAFGAESRAEGAWGLKRDMPPALRTKLVHIQALDSREQQTRFESAQSNVLHMRRWRQLFPTKVKPEVPSPIPTARITSMSTPEWSEFLAYAGSRKRAWQEALKSGEYLPTDLYKFLQATTATRGPGQHYQTGSSYYQYRPTAAEAEVPGRMLSRDASGFAVGVGGFVAGLIKPGMNKSTAFSSRERAKFYVRKAVLTGGSHPLVELAEQPSDIHAQFNVGQALRGSQRLSFGGQYGGGGSTSRYAGFQNQYQNQPRFPAHVVSGPLAARQNQEHRADQLLNRMNPGSANSSTAPGSPAFPDAVSFNDAALQTMRETISGMYSSQPNRSQQPRTDTGSYERSQSPNVNRNPFGVRNPNSHTKK
ncbi:hypothetical protein H4R33_006337 [Dimargaris cristalligena]|uniref:Uncharacterized protein n=1 Tax=Dimargaris cristalligena TaxID=215637 RepID=A0A4P9ZQK0_9FUNG|nr:hypothetical protein H4R33_006337 [Dimargaris cristalligena]RKP34912.1 hypothetical protein BJ085DRAFT_41070 [Dimargaris cristalligena]|eukprot:RKP34912.1 hypothetical protein BJ085DRAFT_41070 [Dimargaris cristalligena]